MTKGYVQTPSVGQSTRFASAPMAGVEFSRMTATPTWYVPFNAGDIVPVYYAEVLPHDTFSIDLDFVIRQNTVLRPTMGNMQVDFYAFFVPNRIINESWKNVQGENTSGFWTAPEVELAPLFKKSSLSNTSKHNVQVPVGSVADFYGFPTQAPIDVSVLMRCNDLKFRGYLEVFNSYFLDKNYQPPIPYSKLNVYNGFFDTEFDLIAPDGFIGGGANPTYVVDDYSSADGSFPNGAITKALYGEGGQPTGIGITSMGTRLTTFNALGAPLKANKLHDPFTSVLPSPQKGAEIFFGVGDSADVQFSFSNFAKEFPPSPNSANKYLEFATSLDSVGSVSSLLPLVLNGVRSTPLSDDSSSRKVIGTYSGGVSITDQFNISGMNLEGTVDLSNATGISVNELRTAIATQAVYETLARGGSRYSSIIRNFFELDIDSPFADIPVQLGHIRRDLDLYQVAQTSATTADSPQGTLSAFGYTTNGGHLFTKTFVEHGYIHIFAVVRQKNVYSTYLSPDNFRLSTLDFYLPQLANIGEQPVKLEYLNPFLNGSAYNGALGFQEAWWEYRFEPDRAHGFFRSGIEQSLDIWTYTDPYDSSFRFVDGDWLKSNAETVLNRTLAVTSELAPQFKGLFKYKIDKQRPMPTYSVPGLDTI